MGPWFLHWGSWNKTRYCNRVLGRFGSRGAAAGLFPGEGARRRWGKLGEKREGTRVDLWVISVCEELACGGGSSEQGGRQWSEMAEATLRLNMVEGVGRGSITEMRQGQRSA
jgi:hypothetical protein